MKWLLTEEHKNHLKQSVKCRLPYCYLRWIYLQTWKSVQACARSPVSLKALQFLWVLQLKSVSAALFISSDIRHKHTRLRVVNYFSESISSWITPWCNQNKYILHCVLVCVFRIHNTNKSNSKYPAVENVTSWGIKCRLKEYKPRKKNPPQVELRHAQVTAADMRCQLAAAQSESPVTGLNEQTFPPTVDKTAGANCLTDQPPTPALVRQPVLKNSLPERRAENTFNWTGSWHLFE